MEGPCFVSGITGPDPHSAYPRSAMTAGVSDGLQGPIATAVWLAAYAAILLWYVALFSFGLSGEAVRSTATEVAT
jgi:hypothetical protein